MSFEALVRALAPRLRRIACKYRGSATCADEEDLYGVMLEFLWERWNGGALREKTESYVVQSCYFHLRNYLRTAREACRCVSLEEGGAAGFPEEGDDAGGSLGDALSDGSRDMAALTEGNALCEKIMSNGLTKLEKDIVRLLCDGYSVRETGKLLGMSHVMVIKRRKHIARKVSAKYGYLLP